MGRRPARIGRDSILALIRSTWDYIDRLPQFLAWVEATGRRTRLLNPPAVVRWNTDKHSPWAELARARVAVVIRPPSWSRARIPQHEACVIFSAPRTIVLSS